MSPLTRQQNALIKAGAVFLMEDNLVVFPKERADGAGARQGHSLRWAIVLLGPGFYDLTYPLVHVVPCSASSQAGKGEYQIPRLEMDRQPCIFDKPVVVAFANLVQPCLKADLVKHMGNLLPSTLAGVQAQAARALGLVSAMQEASAALIKGAAAMPPRRPAAAPSATPEPPAAPEHDE